MKSLSDIFCNLCDVKTKRAMFDIRFTLEDADESAARAPRKPNFAIPITTASRSRPPKYPKFDRCLLRISRINTIIKFRHLRRQFPSDKSRTNILRLEMRNRQSCQNAKWPRLNASFKSNRSFRIKLRAKGRKMFSGREQRHISYAFCTTKGMKMDFITV